MKKAKKTSQTTKQLIEQTVQKILLDLYGTEKDREHECWAIRMRVWDCVCDYQQGIIDKAEARI